MATPRAATFPSTRRSLLTRLKKWDDSEGWKEFFDTYWKLLYGFARKASFTDGEAQDLVQETIAAVAKSIPGFHYDPKVGTFKSWLFTILHRRIIDRQRKRQREVVIVDDIAGKDSTTRPIDRVPDPSGPDLNRIWENEWHQHLFENALGRVKQKVEARQFQIFDCYVLQEWPVTDVAKRLRVSEQQVYTAKHRIGALLKEEVARLQKEPTGQHTND